MLQAETYQEQAVLCFVREGSRVLLIEKRRGLGAGKVNAPGGKVEPGETYLQAAIRETREEVCVEAGDLHLRGALGFRFADGYSLYVQVFVAQSHTGTPAETPEAHPFWCETSEIPYGRMWADDIVWLPQVLDGYEVEGDFTFDGDRMTGGTVQLRWQP